MRYTMNTNEKHDTPLELIEFIKTGMDRVSGSFFSVVTCGDVKPIARERVYCYELYHQMRSIQENDNKYPSLCKYILHAEIDKSGHPIIHNNFKNKNLNKIPFVSIFFILNSLYEIQSFCFQQILVL